MGKFLVTILVVCGLATLETTANDTRLLVDKLRYQVLLLENEEWQEILNPYKSDVEEAVTYAFKSFSLHFNDMLPIHNDTLYGLQIVRYVPSFLTVYSDMRVVAETFDKFQRYLAQYDVTSDKNTEITVDDIIYGVLKDPNINCNKTINRILKQVFGKDRQKDTVAGELFELIKGNDCLWNTQSEQQVFYNLYNVLALTELKAYIMMQFSYMMLFLEQNDKNIINKSVNARNELEDRSKTSSSLLRTMEKVLWKKIYKCDPKIHVEGVTYEKLTRLLQGHIENEVDLNDRGTCTATCPDYQYTNSYGCYDSKTSYCRDRQPCRGKIHNCRYIESHMKACISPKYSSRRYEYVQFDSGRTMGKKNWCASDRVTSWRRWFVHCTTCVCLCDEKGSLSDRYFSLRPVMANVRQNRVITGLRIVKHNRIIHLQIQEGQLLPYGYINQSSVEWKPVDNFQVSDYAVSENRDFHTINYEQRTMLLDEINSHDSQSLITGVRFIFDKSSKHLKFGIFVQRFDFKTGKLSNDSHYIFGSGERYPLSAENAKIPIESPPSEPAWDTNKYIRFTHTSFDADFAQTTVPYFDSQPVASKPAVPLNGAGIYYKGKPGYGGFVAPTISTYNFNEHIKAYFPDIPERNFYNAEPPEN